MTESPLVSIITPVFNGAEYIEELIESVLQQDYPNIEHLIIDDGSQDDGATIAILQKYPHLRWWSRENRGQYETMNEGLSSAKGDVVCFVSADDLLSSGAVTAAMDFLQLCPQYDGVFGITNYVDTDGKIRPYLVPFRKAPISFYPYFAHISHCSFYVYRSAILDHQLFFDSTLQYAGDYDWLIQISRSSLKIGVIDPELSKVRLHPDQTSQRNEDDSFVEVRRILERHQVNKIFYSALQGIYLLLHRLWKLNYKIKKNGLSDGVLSVLRWWNMRSKSER